MWTPETPGASIRPQFRRKKKQELGSNLEFGGYQAHNWIAVGALEDVGIMNTLEVKTG